MLIGNVNLGLCNLMVKRCFIFSLLGVCLGPGGGHSPPEDSRSQRGNDAFNKPATCLDDIERKLGHFRVHLNKLFLLHDFEAHLFYLSNNAFFSVIYLLFFSVTGREHQ